MIVPYELGLEGRMTYAFANTKLGEFADEDVVALLTKIYIRDDRHSVTEIGYLLSQLGGWVGAVVGRDSGGTTWAVVIQAGPASGAGELQLMLDQALSVVGGLEVADRSWLDVWEIVGRYVQAGAGIVDPRSLGFAPLLQGLIAEMAGYDVAEFVARFPDGCAYPQTNHYCQGDVLSDILRSWQDGNQSYQPEADPDDELDGQGS